MKKIIALMLATMLVGCASHTEYGPCVGIGEDKNPNLVYKISTQNLIVAIFFFQLIAPPVIVAVDEFYCPVGFK
jgi:hypothetical protein